MAKLTTTLSPFPEARPTASADAVSGLLPTQRALYVTNTATTAAENIVTIDRRRTDRRGGEACETQTAEPTQRRKQQRRRQIDPTTCEREYNEQEIEFMHAMDQYKRAAGRMFPTCSEVLEVVRSLGYVQLDDDQRAQLNLDDSDLVECYSGEACDDDED